MNEEVSIVVDCPSSEIADLLDCFTALLLGPSGDGKHKRETAGKPHWREADTSHRPAMMRHLARELLDPGGLDPDNGKCLHLEHLAWRALALAQGIRDGRLA